MRRQKVRKYQYTPRFYKEEKDEEAQRANRFQFSRNKYSRKKKRSYIFFVLLLILVLILLNILNRRQVVDPEDVKFDDVETVK